MWPKDISFPCPHQKVCSDFLFEPASEEPKRPPLLSKTNNASLFKRTFLPKNYPTSIIRQPYLPTCVPSLSSLILRIWSPERIYLGGRSRAPNISFLFLILAPAMFWNVPLISPPLFKAFPFFFVIPSSFPAPEEKR